MLPMFTLFALNPAAHAFCGTYVGQAGSELLNGASQVAIAREGARTTLTLANDYEGDLTEFAIVVPVPEILGEEDVTVLDGEIMQRLDLYSGPRLVSYECSDFVSSGDYDYATEDSGGGGTGESADDSVSVEAQFAVGEYEIVILSATESSGLLTWLTDNGYAVDAGAEDLLGEYIEAGSYFFAAKVFLDSVGSGGEARDYLSPLQFGYDSDIFSLPIRLGTINSPGVQDLLIFAVTGEDDGSVGIANYPEVTVEDDCMWRGPGDGEDPEGAFGRFYQGQVESAWNETDGAGWITEYSWAPSGCDPCSGEPPSEEDLHALGYSGDEYSAFFTRLHVRYTPEAATQDLVLYTSGTWNLDQIKYVVYRKNLEEYFAVCDEGWISDPGTCDDETGWTSRDGESTGCLGKRSALLLLVPGLLAVRRRRSRST